MTEQYDWMPNATRRTVMGGIGALGAGALASGSAGATGNDDEPGDEPPEEPEQIGFPPEHLTEWGPSQDVGNGEAETFVTMNDAGFPILVGVYFTADALDGLPEDFAHFALELPETGEETVFEWVALDWAAGGHGPPGVYTVPHNDIHFYMMPEDEVQEIPPVNYPPGEDPDAEPYLDPIPEDQYPPNHIRDHAVVPAMGEHLPDITSPEWNEEPFGNTFVWGHWDGNLSFYEPMVTVDYFEDMARGQPQSPLHERQETRRIAMPERMPEAGRYPTEYTVRYHESDDAYSVTLELFKEFEESEE